MRIRLLPRTLLVVAALLMPPLVEATAAAQTPRALIETLGDKAIKSLTGNVPRAEREQRFQTLLRDGFDVEAIGRFTLGRYWRQATPEQQAEYLKLFERFIVQAYAARFAEYTGEQFRVTGERPDGDVVLVQSEIFKAGAPPTKVEWRVAHNSAPKIVDVVVEGVSMAVTQRSEFAAVIQRSGGSVDGLLAALRSKTSG
ncbi:MAG: ABC transporter substrate-binding protein [Alphaproteobacteria bacterium]|nr:ABC transporter substrate-binding protein [Alphaproteobacteria bacterium]